MLILTRFPGQAIRIDQHIRLLIVTIRGRCVTVGIEAPTDVTVDREEIFERKRAGTKRSER